MDKQMAKTVVATAGVTSPEGLVIKAKDLTARDPMPRPYVVKPVREGSSVGVHIVREGDNQPPIAVHGWQPEQELLVEPYIAGRELTVGVMDDKALAVTEIRPIGEGFYDYDAKYSHDTKVARSEEHTSELQSLMRTSYAVFCLKKKKTRTPKP